MKRHGEIIALVALIACVVLIRFYGLGEKPFHHDESIHAWFSYCILKGLPYKFDPVYHGPLLYWANAALFKLAGASDFTARFLPALASVGLILLCFALRRELGNFGWIVVSLFIGLSPTFSYYGRFLGHDDFVAFFTLALVVLAAGFIRRPKAATIYLFFMVLGLFISTKACFYIHTGLFVIFILLAVALDSFAPRYPRKWIINYLRNFLVEYRIHIMLGLALFMLVYACLYSSFFSNPGGVIDGIAKMVGYWYGQQVHPRIPGPVYYYIPRLIFHEPVIWLALPALFLLARKKAKPFDVFLGFWTISSFAVYSFAQEKVPWLLMHPLLPLCLVAGRYFQMLLQSKSGFAQKALLAVLVILISWSARETLWLCFQSDPASAHLLKYMATARTPKQTAKILNHIPDSKGQIFVTGDATWALAWYLRDKNVSFFLP